MMFNKKMLVVLAHPDDESFGMGGTLALYASQGVEIYLCCGTRGEAGDLELGTQAANESVGEVREKELHCAALVLGIKHIEFLGFRDSGMPGTKDNQHPLALVNQPLEVVAGKIATLIREFQPNVVITHDPIGGYRHPDHIAVHKAAELGFHLAGNLDFSSNGTKPYQPEFLYYHTFPRAFLMTAVKILRFLGKDPSKFGKNGDIDLESIALVEFPVHAEINISKFRKVKEKAGACHASQGGRRIGGGLVGLATQFFKSNEAFMQAYPPVEGNIKKKNDLFV